MHMNTLRTIVKKAGKGNGFGWANKSARYRGFSADFEFVSTVSGYDRRDQLTDGYVRFTGNQERKRESEALLRLWLLENGYTYEFVKKETDTGKFNSNTGERIIDIKILGIKIMSSTSVQAVA